MKQLRITSIAFIAFTLSPLTIMAQSHTKPKESQSAQIRKYRTFFDRLGNIYPAHKAVDITYARINGVPCYRFVPDGIKNGDIIIYLHGGSFALGSIQSHRAMLSHFAVRFRNTIIYVEYRLAPEHPFPCGRNDFLHVYKAIAAAHTKGRIFLMGDSAGGGILLSGLHELSDSRAPDGIVLISPWLDLNCDNGSFETRSKSDPILTREELRKFAAYYAPAEQSIANPAQLTFSRLPPSLLLVGSNEVLYDDTQNFYDKARKIQQHVTMAVFEQQTHVWPLTDIHSHAAAEVLDKIVRFMDGE